MAKKKEERDHALLAASSASRWLTCTPSARLEEQFPDTTSEAAKEGTLAHAIAELKVKKRFIEPMGPRKFKNALEKLKADPLYKEEMLGYTDEYMDYIESIVHKFDSPPYMAVEKQLDYSAYAQEGFGTGDCIIIGGNEIHVIDFKYGKGVPVFAEENPQMKLYALGAYMEYSFLYPIETVHLTIVQPRLDSISEWNLSATALLSWGESIKPIAVKAYAGEGEFVPSDACRFCRAKSLCRARTDFNLQLEVEKGKMPPLITNEEVGNLLIRAKDLAKWANDLEDYALSSCLKGDKIPGWKAVEGRKDRTFTDQDAAFKKLIDGGITEEAMLYERKPLTLTKVEGLVGKKKFSEELSDFITRKEGKPTLAHESDNREAITNKIRPQEAFAN